MKPTSSKPEVEVVEPRHSFTIDKWREMALPVLSLPDPVKAIFDSQSRFFGGDNTPAKITYLSATSRVLKVLASCIASHLQLVGGAASGKTWVWKIVKKHLPYWAVVEYDAGSAKLFLHDDSNLMHKVLVFSEMDSVPQGEDAANVAVSAMRILMSEGKCNYKYVNSTGSGITIKSCDKVGPVTLLTTGVRSLGEQNGSRMFYYEMNENAGQIAAAVKRQAELSVHGIPEVEDSVIAVQAYLQALAERDGGIGAVVPFSLALGEAMLEKGGIDARVLRDKPRLEGLVMSVAILRMEHRQRDSQGRIVATMEDYETVRDILSTTYDSSVNASPNVMRVVEAVESRSSTGTTVGVTEIREWLSEHATPAEMLNDKAIRRTLAQAVTHHFLKDCREKPVTKTTPWAVSAGEATIREGGLLPTSSEVRRKM
jgi:hypothetical protein